MEFARQILDLLQNLGIHLWRVTAGMQQRQNQRSEFVAQRDAREARTGFLAVAQDRERGDASVLFGAFSRAPGDLVGEARDIDEQRLHVLRGFALAQRGDQLDRRPEVAQVAFQLGFQGIVQHGPVFFFL